ncbi:hypothetical protein LTR70_002898 [Exophiala xenobiotica]|uniref:Adhesin domain-containing protein n=1 Tax=Lithohypha guttulata TaxID=1690604 RepID=A0ABR0KHN3_9EURO|nr:hypothetical protein LTR24_002495 [Lithohypha guttulata]KAK5324451.1 hypothetical protein LTR70_002898 [Exophiala xenobiotica]
MDAAALALDLATASPWSDALSSSVASHQESMNSSLTGSHELSYSRNHIATEGTGLEPPPPYYPPHEYDLNIDLADPELEDMRLPVAQQETTALNSPVHGVEESEHEDNLDAPLLDEPDEKSPGGRYPWMRVNSTARIRTLRSWRLYTAIGLVVASRQKSPPQRNLPLVPTHGQNHTQHAAHEDIIGRFPLWDRLELSTTTGSIDVEIDPMPVNGTAEIILSSSTGNIKLGISDSWWMRGKERTLRSIRTEIKTVQGNVYGRILLGNGGYASVDSVSGAQDLRVFVYSAGANNAVSELITRSHIGDQVVALTHFGDQDSTISSLKCEHHSLGTSNLDLQYSHAWRGEVHAVTSAYGHLEVQGDIRLVFDKKDENEVLAHKGDDPHRYTVDVISDGTGSVCFKSWYTW